MMSFHATGRLAGALLVEHYTYEPGPAVALPRHSHDQFQLCYNPDYVGQVWIGGEWHTVPTGRVALVPPGETHAVRDVADRITPGEYRVLYVAPSLVAGISDEMGMRDGTRPAFDGFTHAGGRLAAYYHRLHVVLEQPAPQLERDDLLWMTFAGLLAAHSARRHRRPPADAGRGPVHLVRDHLHDHLTDNVSLAELAGVANLSPYHLLRVFRREFGLTPHAYQAQARVEHAKRLLAHGGSVTRAAHDSGFFDASHLTRHFRRVVGVSPGRYARTWPSHARSHKPTFAPR